MITMNVITIAMKIVIMISIPDIIIVIIIIIIIIKKENLIFDKKLNSFFLNKSTLFVYLLSLNSIYKISSLLYL
jgi:hypothetical protein